MKRSCAPSFKNSIFNNNFNRNSNEEADGGVNDKDDDYQWGSRLNIRKRHKNHNNETKRFFNVVWRDVTTKKHKTWRGDGTLEVDLKTNKIILLNEDGSYLACNTNIIKNINDFGADFQMVIGSKEIEIQNEVLDTNELYKVSDQLMSSTNWDEQQMSSSSGEKIKVPKGAFIFKPSLILNNIKPTLNKKQPSKSNNSLKQNASINEYICLIQSSELQEYLFTKMYNFYNDHQPESTEVIEVLQEICNHPSLLNRKSITNDQMNVVLTSSLPNWNEMGVFDSGKMEFIQQQITNVKHLKEDQFISAIIADNENCTNMLEEFCTYLNIKYKRFEGDGTVHFLTEEANVVLLSSKQFNQYVQNHLDLTKQIIVFENVHSLLALNILETLSSASTLKNGIFIYLLITSFSIEDVLLYHHFSNTEFFNNIDTSFKELIEIAEKGKDNFLSSCYVAWKLTEDTSKIFNNKWQYISGPFTPNFLEDMQLNNEVNTLNAVFKRKSHM